MDRRPYPHVALSWLVFLLFLMAGGPAYGQALSFSANVDKNPVGIGEQFTLSLVLGNAGMNGGSNLKLPDLSKFHIMSGPNQSSSVEIINGATTSSVTYGYVLQPKEIGKFVIGPASIDVGGTTYKTAPLTLEVVKSLSRQRQQASTQGDLGTQIGDNLFLKAVVDRTHVLQGEQINLTFKLYTRVSVLNYGIEKSPTLAGFWSEDVDIPKNISLTTETVNGKQFRVGVIKRMALFPTQSGTLEISPMQVQTTVQVQARSSDPFESFFRDPFGRTMNYEATSEPLKIRVDPLPSGAPPEFKGAVGEFAMSANTDKKTTRTNEPVDLKVTISGTGNIKILESPTVEIPPDFEQYSPKVTDNINRQGDRISGSKSFEYLLIPRYPGLKIIKPITFAYYDLRRHDYVRLRSPQIELNVEQGAAPLAPMTAGTTQEQVQLLSQDIRFIKVDPPSFLRLGEMPYARPTFVLLLLLPLAGLAGAFVYARQRQAVMLDEAGYRFRRASRVAQKGLKQAEYLLSEKHGPSGTPSAIQRTRFYSEISRAIWKYLGDKLSIPPAKFSAEVAIAELRRRSVSEGVCTALRQLLETCDMARFAPTALEVSAMQRTYDEAKRVIVELEHVLRKR